VNFAVQSVLHIWFNIMYCNPGVLTRCLASLEHRDLDGSKSTGTSDALKEVIIYYANTLVCCAKYAICIMHTAQVYFLVGIEKL
jgi:hypothetical protein